MITIKEIYGFYIVLEISDKFGWLEEKLMKKENCKNKGLLKESRLM